MIGIGDSAPQFELPDQSGNSVSLSELLEAGPLILYFYPADFSSLCTLQARAFQDVREELTDSGIQIVAISPQSVASHHRFAASNSLQFPLLFDPSKRVIRAYGVDGPFGIGVRRATFLVGTDGFIASRVLSDFLLDKHLQLAKQLIES